MYKGFRGFLSVGSYMIPILAALWCVYIYVFLKHNTPAAWWAGVSIIWCIDGFCNNVRFVRANANYNRMLLWNSTLANYILSLPDHKVKVKYEDSEGKVSETDSK